MHDVAFSYNQHTVLRNINLRIERGDFVGIMGNSGSGKTTLLRLITGQLKPQHGTILINGQNLNQFSFQQLLQYRQHMGVLFQFGALFSDLSVFDNIAFPLREHTQLPEEMIRDLVILKLNAVGLHGIEDKMPSELSGGMARRVALARSIALDPKIMLYDEPFSGLDPITLGVIATLITQINTALKSTSLMVTHDIQRSLDIVNRVIFLAQGEVVFSGSPIEFKQHPSPWIQQFIAGNADGPVAFHYPASKALYQTLAIPSHQTGHAS